jgi:hypothetical protein
MSPPIPPLPVARVALKILIVLNGCGRRDPRALVACRMSRIMSAFELSPSPETDRLVMGSAYVLGRRGPLSYVVLGLLAIVIRSRGRPVAQCVRSRRSLRALVLQLLSVVIGAIAKALLTWHRSTSMPAFDQRLAAVLLTFVLARVFAEGALMREDLERTV